MCQVYSTVIYREKINLKNKSDTFYSHRSTKKFTRYRGKDRKRRARPLRWCDDDLENDPGNIAGSDTGRPVAVQVVRERH